MRRFLLTGLLTATLLPGCCCLSSGPAPAGSDVAYSESPDLLGNDELPTDAYAPDDVFIKAVLLPPGGVMSVVFYEHPHGRWGSRMHVRHAEDGIHLTLRRQAMPAEGRLPAVESNFTHDPKTLFATFRFPNPDGRPVFLDGPGEPRTRATKRIWPEETGR